MDSSEALLHDFLGFCPKLPPDCRPGQTAAPDPQKLRLDRREAVFAVVNAENDLRSALFSSRLLVTDALEMDFAEERQAARRYLEAVEQLLAVNAKVRELGVQP